MSEPCIEILNDDATPMFFVATVLGEVLGMTVEDANELMMAIHGGTSAFLSCATFEEAEHVAAAINARAHAAGFPLTCRAYRAMPPEATH